MNDGQITTEQGPSEPKYVKTDMQKVVEASYIAAQERVKSITDIQQEEIVLTGDDLVVEYVDRLAQATVSRPELPSHIAARINQFIHYRVWSVSNLP